MKGKGGIGAVTMVVLVMIILFTGHATAEFKTCFAACIIRCAIISDRLPCAVKCLASCITHKTSDELYYCGLGCSVDQCAKFGDEVDKVGSCVDNCENSTCDRKMKN
ncbi:unnamed protein product [Ilex paraguariensis]|uniref:Uncharacterized protein n=1 Tax=Ilex paraguariensis TaxID=185542 RepID=A0ABC8TZY4_9AQUA